MKKIGVILAAGKGKRLKEKIPKCLFKINNQELYKYSLDTFLETKIFDLVILVLPKIIKLDNKYLNKNIVVLKGGKTRNESLIIAFNFLKGKINDNDIVVSHDAARIFVNNQDIINISNCKLQIATLCFKSTDTIYATKKISFIQKPIYNIQTPQMCRFSFFNKAKKNYLGTDLFSFLCVKPNIRSLIYSSNGLLNMKITHPDDIKIAKFLLNKYNKK